MPKTPKQPRVRVTPAAANVYPGGRETRSKTAPGRAAALAAQQAQVAAAAQALAQQRAAALANRPTAQPGNRGDGSLHIAFMRVGQGDSAIMSTPQGRVLMFDCGSDAGEDDPADKETNAVFTARLQAIINGPKFLAGSNTIDALITTHPDTDHYNLLSRVLDQQYTINNWYFSALRTSYSQGGASGYLLGRLANSTTGDKKVVLNHDPANGAPGEVSINSKAVVAAGGGVTEDRLDGNGGIRIVDEPNCKISILAADVLHQYQNDGSNPNNRGSIVTLIEVGPPGGPIKKVLMCGDATTNTETFLMNTVKARIAGLDVLQAGHHASIVTSSQQAFVDLVDPRLVIASAGKKILLHSLPSGEVIVRYRKRLATSLRTQIAQHETFYYEATGWGNRAHGSSFDTYQVFTTGSRDTLEVDL